MTVPCVREDEVVSAVVGRRWESSSDELRAHAAACESCREVVAVASLLSSDHDRARHDVHVPAAGQIWWRCAVRARLEAAHAAARPLTWLHGIAGACAVGLMWTVGGTAWPRVREAVGWMLSQAVSGDSRVGDVAVMVAATVQRSLPVALLLAACLLVAPVAVYFALSDD
jgi:hypothetical protein